MKWYGSFQAAGALRLTRCTLGRLWTVNMPWRWQVQKAKSPCTSSIPPKRYLLDPLMHQCNQLRYSKARIIEDHQMLRIKEPLSLARLVQQMQCNVSFQLSKTDLANSPIVLSQRLLYRSAMELSPSILARTFNSLILGMRMISSLG